MPTYRMTIEYDGADFCGWQIQPEQPSLQAAVQDALTTALRRPVDVVGSGRTDSGVHARGQVAHFQHEGPVDTHRLLASVNGILPRSIAVRDLSKASDGFHARYDAMLRRYHYYVTTGFRALDRHMRWRVRPIPDFDKMNEAARDLLGTHDFDSFCIAQSETENRVCALKLAHWSRESVDGDWRFEIAADRFLHGMVRAIVGTLLEIGHGRRPKNDIPRILSLKDRREAGPSAPAFALVLEQVSYRAAASIDAASHQSKQDVPG